MTPPPDAAGPKAAAAAVTAPAVATEAATSGSGTHRYFIMRSNSVINLYLSCVEAAWATQKHNEARLNEAFASGAVVRLLFSVNASGAFQGYATMRTAVGKLGRVPVWDNGQTFGVALGVDWKCLCDLPHGEVEHLRNSLNEGKSVKIARDGQEVPADVGDELVKLLEARAKATGAKPPKVQAQILLDKSGHGHRGRMGGPGRGGPGGFDRGGPGGFDRGMGPGMGNAFHPGGPGGPMMMRGGRGGRGGRGMMHDNGPMMGGPMDGPMFGGMDGPMPPMMGGGMGMGMGMGMGGPMGPMGMDPSMAMAMGGLGAMGGMGMGGADPTALMAGMMASMMGVPPPLGMMGMGMRPPGLPGMGGMSGLGMPGMGGMGAALPGMGLGAGMGGADPGAMLEAAAVLRGGGGANPLLPSASTVRQPPVQPPPRQGSAGMGMGTGSSGRLPAIHQQHHPLGNTDLGNSSGMGVGGGGMQQQLLTRQQQQEDMLRGGGGGRGASSGNGMLMGSNGLHGGGDVDDSDYLDRGRSSRRRSRSRSPSRRRRSRSRSRSSSPRAGRSIMDMSYEEYLAHYRKAMVKSKEEPSRRSPSPDRRDGGRDAGHSHGRRDRAVLDDQADMMGGMDMRGGGMAVGVAGRRGQGGMGGGNGMMLGNGGGGSNMTMGGGGGMNMGMGASTGNGNVLGAGGMFGGSSNVQGNQSMMMSGTGMSQQDGGSAGQPATYTEDQYIEVCQNFYRSKGQQPPSIDYIRQYYRTQAGL